MSYRYRLIKVKKEVTAPMGGVDKVDFLRAISKINPNVSVDGDTLMPYAYEMFNQEEIFDFGSDFNAYKEVVDTSTRFFSDDELNSYYEDYNIRLCNRDTLLAIIEAYRKIVFENFQKLSTSSPEKIKQYFENKTEEWGKYSDLFVSDFENKSEEIKEKYNRIHYPYNLNSPNCIVNSWLFEYEVFELVYILKTFDWENYDLLFYGW